MFRQLIALALQRPFVVLVGAALLLLAATWRVGTMPVDVFPELNAPTVVVMAESPGLAADEVEQTVTFPLETATAGLPGVRRVRSASAIGLGIVWVEFDWGEDIFRARTLVAEKLSAVRENLPANVHAEITPITSITGEIMLLSVTSPDGRASPQQLRTYAEFDLRNRLMAVPGVAQVVAIGGELAEYQVLVRQDDLRLFDLTLDDVLAAARAAHATSGAGYLPDVEGLELPIRQTGRVRSLADLAGAVVAHRDGHPVTIGQVAEVRLGAAPSRGAAADDARKAVVLSVQKSPGTNTLALTDAIDRKLAEAQAALPPGMALNTHVMRQADFIQRSVDNLVKVLRDAAIFIVIVLVLFLMDVRTTLITLTALPLSLAVAFLVLSALGLTINVMTLGGLAVAIGELVDDAIIDVENVFRRLRENAARPAGERAPVLRVVFQASNEIRSAVVFATVILGMVFVPLLFLSGLEGRFFRPLAIAYIASTFASLIVALTVTPVLCRLLLGKLGAGGDHGPSRLVVWLQARYARVLQAALRRRKPLLAGAGLAAAASLAVASTFGTSFLPSFHEGTFTVFLMAPPGTSLAESDRLASGIEAQLCAIPGVRTVVRRTGRAERDEHAEPVSSSEIEVVVAAEADRAAVRAGIDAVLGKAPGVTTAVGQPIEHRLSHVMSGTPAAIAVTAYGDDLAVLRSLAKELEAAIKAVPGTRDVLANREVMITSLPVRYRPQDLAAAGLSPAEAARQVQHAIAGAHAVDVIDGSRRIALTVRLHPDERADVDDVGALELRGGSGARVRLRDVADLGRERASNLIARENGRRKAVVSCNVADGHNLGDVAVAIERAVAPIVAAAGCALALGGQFEAQQSASRTILGMGAIALVVMLLLLHGALGSLPAALLVMVNLPLALIGGVAAVYLTAGPGGLANTLALLGISGRAYEAPVLSIASLVGFITLFGIAVRNGILMVRHFLDLMREGVPAAEAVARGAHERLVPILMTALCATLGLLPIVLAAGEPGSEILAPLSVVVLGGLVTSTLLNLLVVPAGFLLLFHDRTLATRPDDADLLAP